MVKKKSRVASNDLGATDSASIFVAVAEKIERKQWEAPFRVTIPGGNTADVEFSHGDFPIDLTRDNLTGLSESFTILGSGRVSLTFDSTENMHRYIDEKLPPETGAWRRIAEIAKMAKGDQWVKQSESAIAFLGMIEAMANLTIGGDSSAQVMGPLSDFLKSEQARKNAQSKNGAARAWVLSEWEGRTDRNQGKAAFSRQYSPLVKQKFSLLVTSDTIARDWLPKGKA
jgi:hypothetical protein